MYTAGAFTWSSKEGKLLMCCVVSFSARAAAGKSERGRRNASSSSEVSTATPAHQGKDAYRYRDLERYGCIAAPAAIHSSSTDHMSFMHMVNTPKEDSGMLLQDQCAGCETHRR